MGMIGNYIALDNALLKQILEGEADILDMEPYGSETLNIDKSWQAISYLLCDNMKEGKSPADYVVPMGQDNLLDCDLDYGAFYLTAAQVKEASDFLSAQERQMLRERYDFQSMKEDGIYPIVEGDNEEEFFQYMYSNLEELTKYYKETADKGKAIIFFIM